MKNLTRIVFFIKKSCFYLQRKNSFFKEVFSFALFTLFFGFLIGNVFGTFLNTIRSFIRWDGFIIFIILFIMEFYNCFLYNRFFKKDKDFFFKKDKDCSPCIPPFPRKVFPCCWYKAKELAHPLFVFFSYKQNLFTNNQMIWKTVNLLKIGILFGFFIDAFKVGS